jgi:hypothetical protein
MGRGEGEGETLTRFGTGEISGRGGEVELCSLYCAAEAR